MPVASIMPCPYLHMMLSAMAMSQDHLCLLSSSPPPPSGAHTNKHNRPSNHYFAFGNAVHGKESQTPYHAFDTSHAVPDTYASHLHRPTPKEPGGSYEQVSHKAVQLLHLLWKIITQATRLTQIARSIASVSASRCLHMSAQHLRGTACRVL